MRKIERFVVYGVLALLLLLVAFFDYQISVSLYDPGNLFGKLGETLGEVPAFLLVIFACSLISRFHPRVEKRGWDVFLTLFFLAAAIGVSAYAANHLRKLVNRVLVNPDAIKTVVAIILFGGAYFGLGYGLTFLVKKDNAREAFLFAAFVAGLFALSVLLMQGIKMIWLRPRYRTLVAMHDAGILSSDIKEFWLPFYHPQFFTSFAKYQVGATLDGNVITQAQINDVMSRLGISAWKKEEFYSFLSGHTLNSVIVCSACFLPNLFPKWKEKKNIDLYIRIGVYVWAALVGFSRIIRGAHCATDVVCGYLLGAILVDALGTLVYEKTLRAKFAERKQ